MARISSGAHLVENSLDPFAEFSCDTEVGAAADDARVARVSGDGERSGRVGVRLSDRGPVLEFGQLPSPQRNGPRGRVGSRGVRRTPRTSLHLSISIRSANGTCLHGLDKEAQLLLHWRELDIHTVKTGGCGCAHPTGYVLHFQSELRDSRCISRQWATSLTCITRACLVGLLEGGCRSRPVDPLLLEANPSAQSVGDEICVEVEFGPCQACQR